MSVSLSSALFFQACLYIHPQKRSQFSKTAVILSEKGKKEWREEGRDGGKGKGRVEIYTKVLAEVLSNCLEENGWYISLSLSTQSARPNLPNSCKELNILPLAGHLCLKQFFWVDSMYNWQNSRHCNKAAKSGHRSKTSQFTSHRLHAFLMTTYKPVIWTPYSSIKSAVQIHYKFTLILCLSMLFEV